MGLTYCEPLCTNTAIDQMNCGGCGIVCGGGAFCINSACTCNAGQGYCNGQCANLKTDEMNCGACGITCGANQNCVNGLCG